MRTTDDFLNRIRAEFLEMPGMILKPEQVQRLCGVELGLCQVLLDTLVDANFLRVRADGRYARVTDGELFFLRGMTAPSGPGACAGRHEAAAQRQLVERGE